MNRELKYPGRVKIRLVSVFFGRYRMIRAFARIRDDLTIVFAHLSEKAFSEQNSGDSGWAERMILAVWRLRNYVVYELIHPMLDYREPLNYLDYRSRPYERPSTKSGVQDLLQNLHEDIILIYRNNNHKLKDLEKNAHPEAGNMSAKEWLCFAMLCEKSAVKCLKKSLNI